MKKICVSDLWVIILIYKVPVNKGDRVFKTFNMSFFKGNRMGHSVKASLWGVTLLINTRFRIYFRISNRGCAYDVAYHNLKLCSI